MDLAICLVRLVEGVMKVIKSSFFPSSIKITVLLFFHLSNSVFFTFLFSSSDMDSYPNPNFNFVDLLQSQQESGFGLESSSFPLFGTQATEGSNFEQDSPAAAERKERRTWTPTHDAVLISAWLNTSKDPVVGNEQRSVAFWKRIAAYYSASPKIAECDKREASTCKQMWHKINDLVCKFCGAFEAANRAKSSGQNETDVLKHAHEIFFNNLKKKIHPRPLLEGAS